MKAVYTGPRCEILDVSEKDDRYFLRESVVGKKVRIPNPLFFIKGFDPDGWLKDVEVVMEEDVLVRREGKAMIVIPAGQKVFFQLIKLKET